MSTPLSPNREQQVQRALAAYRAFAQQDEMLLAELFAHTRDWCAAEPLPSEPNVAVRADDAAQTRHGTV